MIAEEQNELFFKYLQAKSLLNRNFQQKLQKIKIPVDLNINTVFCLSDFLRENNIPNKAEKRIVIDKQIDGLYKALNRKGVYDLLMKKIKNEEMGLVTIKDFILIKVFHKKFKSDLDFKDYCDKIVLEDRFKNEVGSFLKKYRDVINMSIFKREKYLLRDNEERKKEQYFIESFLKELFIYIDSLTFNYFSDKIELEAKSKVLFVYPLFVFIRFLPDIDFIKSSGGKHSFCSLESAVYDKKEHLESQVVQIKKQIEEATKEKNFELKSSLEKVLVSIEEKEKENISDIFITNSENSDETVKASFNEYITQINSLKRIILDF